MCLARPRPSWMKRCRVGPLRVDQGTAWAELRPGPWGPRGGHTDGVPVLRAGRQSVGEEARSCHLHSEK